MRCWIGGVLTGVVMTVLAFACMSWVMDVRWQAVPNEHVGIINQGVSNAVREQN